MEGAPYEEQGRGNQGVPIHDHDEGSMERRERKRETDLQKEEWGVGLRFRLVSLASVLSLI